MAKQPHTPAQRATRFDGEKSNRNEKGNSSTRIKKSKLRELADKLLERQDIALQLVDKSLAGTDVNADSVASAKWVLNSIVSVIKNATAEELGSFNARLKGKRDEEEAEQTPKEIAAELKPRLSLVFVDPDDNEE